MAASGYHIIDEPRPRPISHLAVNPLWPFFGFIFAGVWLSWPWYVFNGYVVGSPTRRRELGITLAGLAGVPVILVGFGYLVGLQILPEASAPYIRLVLLLWKIGVTYWLYILQSRTFEIYEYYGGRVRNGILVVIAFFYLWIQARQILPPFLYLMLD
jgi:hypothetical protein